MSFNIKDWKNLPDKTTSISAEALKDLESRLSGYTDEVASSKADSNDNRFPTSQQKSALEGTNGAVSDSNRFVTDSDPRLADTRMPKPHKHSVGDINYFSEEIANELANWGHESAFIDATAPFGDLQLEDGATMHSEIAFVHCNALSTTTCFGVISRDEDGDLFQVSEENVPLAGAAADTSLRFPVALLAGGFATIIVSPTGMYTVEYGVEAPGPVDITAVGYLASGAMSQTFMASALSHFS